jgi:hypothetical protein
MKPAEWPKIFCQAGAQVKPGQITCCPWLAAHLCRSCNQSVCAAHWDSFAGICQACARVIESVPQ